MPTLKSPLVPCLALAAGLLSAPAVAEEERWYQVELLIFSHENGASDEQWEPLPTLAYPDTGRFLVYPQQVAARAEAHEGTSEVDEFGRQFLRPYPEPLAEEPAPTPDIPRREAASPPPEEEAPPVDAAAEPPPALPLTPTPFVALPRSSAEFYGKAAYMQRSGNYKTLFHETWVQPVREKGAALPLIIDRSGDSGEWPRLQGSVTLHIARYLHLETRLWLNTSGDYLPGAWQMPAPPLGPVSLIVEEPEPAEEDYFAVDAAMDAEQDPVEDALPAVGETALEEDAGPVYPWRHAVLMQQSRRMRSKEVHYLDHPLLGVVIKLMPLDEEQLQAMAEAEIAEQQAAAQ
ncbi:hypothetical protein DWB85_03790 [Seongchinamella sediminis]|uniref:Peptidoglycan-binding protein CsiV n=1 Tax=Seongchinamella sediminis TaxID=2283635 RepID=A0A3L7E2L7_9GAMM|nr:CsiV family protein [Seongchinamella sediminis]RLQ23105.1 hypothetical protein DWB85_03790 [Seongchinamella sediminis]